MPIALYLKKLTIDAQKKNIFAQLGEQFLKAQEQSKKQQKRLPPEGMTI
ncbi:MAG: hypothetical protein HWN65_22710 [Candidatus Helarchaeota archaeon]|nr:hypothetical protein [Candidatus Helarchaeota archaeon]